MTTETERRCEDCKPGRNWPHDVKFCGFHGKRVAMLPTNPPCNRCGHPTNTPYCTNCGQRSES